MMQADMLAGQTADTKARIMSQLDAQPGGRPFGGVEYSDPDLTWGSFTCDA